MTHQEWIQRYGSQTKALQAAAAYLDPAIPNLDERVYTALWKSGRFEAPWSVTKKAGGLNALPKGDLAIVHILAAGGFKPSKRDLAGSPYAKETILEKGKRLAGQAAAGVGGEVAETVQMLLPLAVKVGKDAAELPAAQRIVRGATNAMESIPRALIVESVTSRQQGRPSGGIKGELPRLGRTLNNLFAATSHNPDLDAILRRRGASYRDVLLLRGVNPSVAAYAGFLLDTLMPDPFTESLGLLSKGAVALRTVQRLKKLDKAGPEVKRAITEGIAEARALESEPKAALAPERPPSGNREFKGADRLPEPTEADRLLRESGLRLAAQKEARRAREAQALAEAVAQKRAAAAERTRLMGELTKTMEGVQQQAQATQKAAAVKRGQALQQQEIETYLKSQPRKEFPGSPKMQVPGGVTVPPQSVPQAAPNPDLLPEYIQALGGPAEVRKRLAAFRAQEAEKIAKAAADKEAAQAQAQAYRKSLAQARAAQPQLSPIPGILDAPGPALSKGRKVKPMRPAVDLEAAGARRVGHLREGKKAAAERRFVQEAEDRLNALEVSPKALPEGPRMPAAAPLQGLRGQKATAYTPASNVPVETEYRVVSLDDLIPSQADDFADNPAYLAEIQPRDRSRIASRQQVEGIAKDLTPDRLGEAGTTAEGAPIVGLDRMVESGNGRVLALRQARATNPQGWAQYQAWLQANAARFGIDPQGLPGVKDGVLVRVRQGELPLQARASLAEEMGRSAVLSMSATEAAAADAARLFRGGILDLMHPESGLFTHANRGFVEKFLGEIPMGERAALMNPKGGLSLAGQERVQNALLSAAYGDSRLLPKLIENPDEDIKSIGYALQEAAPTFARLRREMAAGRVVPEADIVQPLTQAIQTIAAYRSPAMRERGLKLADFLAQTNMFDDPAMPMIKEIVAFMGQSRVSKDKLKAFLKTYATTALKMGQSQQTALGGQAFDPLAFVQDAAKTAQRRGQNLLFDESGKVLLPAKASVSALIQQMHLHPKEALPRLVAMERDAKLVFSPGSWMRDLLGSTLVHSQVYGLTPYEALRDIGETLALVRQKGPQYDALKRLLTSSGHPLARPMGWYAGMTQGAEGAAQAARVPTLPGKAGAVHEALRSGRQSINDFWGLIGVRTQLKRMARFGNRNDIALAQSILSGKGLEAVSWRTSQKRRPVLWSEFTKPAQTALTRGLESVSGNPYALLKPLRQGSQYGILSLFPTYAAQIPWYRLRAMGEALWQGDIMPSVIAAKQSKALLDATRNVPLSPEGREQGESLPLKPPPGTVQLAGSPYPGSFSPMRYAPIRDPQNRVVGSLNLSGLTTEGPVQVLANPGSSLLAALLNALGSGAAGVLDPLEMGPVAQVGKSLYDAAQKPSSPQAPLVNAGLLAPQAAATANQAADAKGILNPYSPGATAARLITQNALQFLPGEARVLADWAGPALPYKLAPLLGIGRRTRSGLPARTGLDVLLYELGASTRPATLDDLARGARWRYLEALRDMNAANR